MSKCHILHPSYLAKNHGLIVEKPNAMAFSSTGKCLSRLQIEKERTSLKSPITKAKLSNHPTKKEDHGSPTLDTPTPHVPESHDSSPTTPPLGNIARDSSPRKKHYVTVDLISLKPEIIFSTSVGNTMRHGGLLTSPSLAS